MDTDGVADVFETIEDGNVLWFPAELDMADVEQRVAEVLAEIGVVEADGSAEAVRIGRAYTWDADGRWSECLLAHNGGIDDWTAIPWTIFSQVAVTRDPEHVARDVQSATETWIEDYDELGAMAVGDFEAPTSNVPWEPYYLDGEEELELDDGRVIDASVARREHLDLDGWG